MSTALEIGATVGTADAGKSVARVAAVQIALYDLLDDQPKKVILPLETSLILGHEPVEMMKKHPVKNGPLRMSGTIESRHSGRMASRNGPTSRIGPSLPGKTRLDPARTGKSF